MRKLRRLGPLPQIPAFASRRTFANALQRMLFDFTLVMLKKRRHPAALVQRLAGCFRLPVGATYCGWGMRGALPPTGELELPSSGICALATAKEPTNRMANASVNVVFHIRLRSPVDPIDRGSLLVTGDPFQAAANGLTNSA